MRDWRCGFVSPCQSQVNMVYMGYPAVYVMQQEVLSQHLPNGFICPLQDAVGFGQGEMQRLEPACNSRFKITQHTARRGDLMRWNFPSHFSFLYAPVNCEVAGMIDCLSFDPMSGRLVLFLFWYLDLRLANDWRTRAGSRGCG